MAKYEIKDGVGIIPGGTTVIEERDCNICEGLTGIVIPEIIITL